MIKTPSKSASDLNLGVCQMTWCMSAHGGVCLGGVRQPGEGVSAPMLGYTSPMNRITDACENISHNLAATMLQTVTRKHSSRMHTNRGVVQGLQDKDCRNQTVTWTCFKWRDTIGWRGVLIFECLKPGTFPRLCRIWNKKHNKEPKKFRSFNARKLTFCTTYCSLST